VDHRRLRQAHHDPEHAHQREERDPRDREEQADPPLDRTRIGGEHDRARMENAGRRFERRRLHQRRVTVNEAFIVAWFRPQNSKQRIW
jgi:hypothetical protein